MGGRWLALASTDVVYEEGGDAVAGARELGRQDGGGAKKRSGDRDLQEISPT